MLKTESDFLAWTSFPSSIKLFNDEGRKTWAIHWLIQDLAVTPGKTLRIEVKAKQQGVASELGAHSDVVANILDSAGKPVWGLSVSLPFGTFDWGTFTASKLIGAGVPTVRVRVSCGPGYPDKPGVTWFDDLKIYQDDVLIYANDFSKWDPVIGAGVGAPIGGVAGYLLKEPLGPMVSEVVGAVVGGALGGGVGLLTGLGIIPAPQIPIPALEAPLEGPGAPARLGKYQITG